jgi:hypothetical protein
MNHNSKTTNTTKHQQTKLQPTRKISGAKKRNTILKNSKNPETTGEAKVFFQQTSKDTPSNG